MPERINGGVVLATLGALALLVSLALGAWSLHRTRRVIRSDSGGQHPLVYARASRGR
jgi:hypothetical protein